MASKVVEGINQACEELRNKTLMGLSLEECSPCLLDVSEADLDEHVVVQPAAIAFYGLLLKMAKRNLDAAVRRYKRWEKKKYAESQAALAGNRPKATKDDIAAKVVIDNEAEIERWETDIEALQEEVDALDAWYEAWRQKSYVLRQHADLAGEELNVKSSLGTCEERDFSERTRTVRDIMARKRKVTGNGAGPDA